MGEINNKAWRLKAVLLILSPLTPLAHATSPASQAGWTARIRLTREEINPSDRWLRFQAPQPPHPPRPAIKTEPMVRIGEPRGWIDPTP